jgi:hypothetical protein
MEIISVEKNKRESKEGIQSRPWTYFSIFNRPESQGNISKNILLKNLFIFFNIDIDFFNKFL